MYLIPKPGSGNGGKWDPVGGFTAVAAIPKGQAAVVHKERLFIAPGADSTTNTSRLRFSDVTDFETWPGSSFIDISPGDGTKLVDLTVFQDNLLLFKNRSTFVLSYDVRPSDAVVREISSTIGVNDQFNMVNYENQIYIFHDDWVYEIVNYDFNRLNTKVPFIKDETAPTAFAAENIFLSLLEDRLICRYYRKIYVYGLRTRTWSEWQSVNNELHYFGPIVTIYPSTGHEYYAGSCLTANETTVQFFDKSTVSTQEKNLAATVFNITCSAKTKNFDMAISHQFKRLWWWGADVSSNNAIVGQATPIVVAFKVTWNQLATKKWNELSTWAQPLTTPGQIQTTVPTGTGTARRFAKFLKSMRYRQINFKVSLTTNGSTTDGPARLFTMLIVTESKQAVSKAVS